MTGRAPLAAVAAASLAGIGISAYLVAVHYQPAALVCSQSGLIDCGLVIGGRYGLVPGTEIPIAAAGLLWFAASLGLSGAALRLPRSARILLAQRAWSAAGIASVLYLVYVEIVLVGAICVWCTAVHLLVLAILLVTVARRLPE